MPRESTLCASIGWSAPSMRHIICRAIHEAKAGRPAALAVPQG
jgi:hypothetical protein